MYWSCGSDIMCCWVGECFVSLWRCVVRYVGGIRSVNVDISNDKVGEKFVCWKIKGFCLMLIGVGWVDF